MAPNDYLLNRVLRRLARHYPNHVEIFALDDLDTPETQRALFYLHEKGLVEPGFISDRPGNPREMLKAKITARGLEVLRGGDKAEAEVTRGTFPPPFEIEALRHFLKQAMESAALSESKRQAATERLMAFSEADMKSLLVRLIQMVSRRPEEIVDVIRSTGR
jgi:hypothetical protein